MGNEAVTAGHDHGEAPTPRWFEQLARWAMAGVLALGLAGVPLAVAGLFEPPLVAAGSAVVLGMLLRLWPAPERRSTTRGAHAAAGAALAVALLSTGWAAAHSGQYVSVERDPGVYLLTGIDLAQGGDLHPDNLQGPFVDAAHRLQRHDAHGDLVKPIDGAGPGFYDRSADQSRPLDPQFFHLVPVLMAVAEWFGGLGAVFRLVPITGGLGLVALYWFGARLVPPWAALLASTALAATMPHQWFSRNGYTEPLTLALAFAGLAVLHDAATRRAPRLGAIAGLLLGATVMARIDMLVMFSPLALVAGATLAWDRHRHRSAHGRWIGAAALGAALAIAIGWIDGVLTAREYVTDLGGQVAGMWGALATALFLAGALTVVARTSQADRLVRWWERNQRTLPLVAGLGVVALGLAVWFVRPAVQSVEQPGVEFSEFVTFLQQAEGSEVRPFRTYDEEGMLRLAAYVGPAALLSALVMAGLVIARVLQGRGARWLPFIGSVGALSAVYVWRASITPDHVWAMRRFLPLTFPGVALLAAAAVAELVRRSRRSAGRWRAVGLLAAGGLGLTFVVSPMAVAWPTLDVRPQQRVAEGVMGICARLGPSVALGLLNDAESAEPGRAATLLPAFEILCDLPVAAIDPSVPISTIEELAEDWEAQGRDLVVLTSDPDPPDGEEPLELAMDVRYELLEQRLKGPPRRETEGRILRWIWYPDAD